MSLTNSQLPSLVTPEAAMILNIASDQIITLDPMGGYVWARLKEGKSVDEIISNLAKETGHDPAVITNDVHEFVEQLTQRHLVILQRSM
jgi:hypothetical protein